MPRKQCDWSSNKNTEKEAVKADFSPNNAIQCERWVKALPNILPKSPIKDMVVGVKHQTTRGTKKPFHQIPVNFLLFFQLKNVLFVRRRYIEYKSCLKSKPQQNYRITQ